MKNVFFLAYSSWVWRVRFCRCRGIWPVHPSALWDEPQTLAGEGWPQIHLKHRQNRSDYKAAADNRGVTVSGYSSWGLAHLLRQQVNVLFVPSLWGAVQLYERQGLAGIKRISKLAQLQMAASGLKVPVYCWKPHLERKKTGVIIPEWRRWWRGQVKAPWSSSGWAIGPDMTFKNT